MKGKHFFLVMIMVLFVLSTTDSQAKPKSKTLNSTFKYACDQAGGEIVEILDPDDGSVMLIYCCYFDDTLGYKVCTDQDGAKMNGNKLRPDKPALQVLDKAPVKKNIRLKAPVLVLQKN